MRAVQLKRIFKVVMNSEEDANNFAADPNHVSVLSLHRILAR
jgi:hypothetical protein